jgi:hypothetical protein
VSGMGPEACRSLPDKDVGVAVRTGRDAEPF